MNVSIIIPTRNEGKIIKQNLSIIERFVKGCAAIDYYEIIVSDFSDDSTKAIMECLNNSKIKFISVNKKGIGEGLRKGIDNSIYDAILFYPIDLTYSLSTITDMVYGMEGDVDISLGSRNIENGYQEKSFKRNISSSLYCWLIQLFFNLQIKDTQGLLGFKKSKVDYLDKIQSNDGFYQTEILIRGRMKNLTIKEYPTIQLDRQHSNINIFSEGIKMFFNMIKFKIRVMNFG